MTWVNVHFYFILFIYNFINYLAEQCSWWSFLVFTKANFIEVWSFFLSMNLDILESRWREFFFFTIFDHHKLINKFIIWPSSFYKNTQSLLFFKTIKSPRLFNSMTLGPVCFLSQAYSPKNTHIFSNIHRQKQW